VLDGFIGTFDARLSPSVTLSTGVSEPETHWKQVVFPVFPARRVGEGETIAVEIGFVTGHNWTYALKQVSRQEDQSTKALSEADLPADR
jgi:hypothetical protein